MDRKLINEINQGAIFKIEKFLLDKAQKIKLMELGILPEIEMQLIQKQFFGSTIIKCEGNKFALDNSVVKKLIINEITI